MKFVKKGIKKKMAKVARKKTKRTIPSKRTQKTRKTIKGKIKAAECVRHLLELHKLQEVLLVQLSKEV